MIGGRLGSRRSLIGKEKEETGGGSLLLASGQRRWRDEGCGSGVAAHEGGMVRVEAPRREGTWRRLESSRGDEWCAPSPHQEEQEEPG
jgi:hypothetical protein